jgi:alpha-mannosidase
MLDRYTRLKAIEGMPATLKFSGPDDFFDTLQKTAKKLNYWRGELYFEFHRGSYTSQGLIKKKNRKCEYLLRNTELLLSIMMLQKHHFNYPKNELDRLWKLLLLYV